jgi:hypothetical protein
MQGVATVFDKSKLNVNCLSPGRSFIKLFTSVIY